MNPSAAYFQWRIINLLRSFGRDQTCAMLLGLASGNTFLDSTDDSTSGTISMISPDVAAVAKQAFYDFGERPMWTERVTYGTSKLAATLLKPSYNTYSCSG